MSQRITIGIPTRQRPVELARLLASLGQQQGMENVTVLVVDNDPSGSAASVVETHKRGLNIDYQIEPRPGVVHVRNRILALSRTPSLVFLDDDQTVEPGWLTAFSEMHANYPADILTGPVRYQASDQYSDTPVGPLSYFVRPEHDNEEIIGMTGTGNTLLPMSVLRMLDMPSFDPAFGACGGEDTELFSRVQLMGAKIRWCAGAVTLETIPRERARMDHIRRRQRRAGYVNGLIAAKRGSRARAAIGGVARMCWGMLRLIFSTLVPRRDDVRRSAIAGLNGGMGYLQAAMGLRFRYYGEM